MKEEPGYGPHIVQYPKEYSMCTGCKTCEIVCSLVHDGNVRQSNRRIACELANPLYPVHTILSCQHCDDHPCYDVCPKKDEAMCLDVERNIAYINEEFCNGCGKCVKACKFTPSRISLATIEGSRKRMAKKCDLCRTRAEGPACVQWCSSYVIGVSDEADAPAMPLEQPFVMKPVER